MQLGEVAAAAPPVPCVDGESARSMIDATYDRRRGAHIRDRPFGHRLDGYRATTCCGAARDRPDCVDQLVECRRCAEEVCDVHDRGIERVGDPVTVVLVMLERRTPPPTHTFRGARTRQPPQQRIDDGHRDGVIVEQGAQLAIGSPAFARGEVHGGRGRDLGESGATGARDERLEIGTLERTPPQRRRPDHRDIVARPVASWRDPRTVVLRPTATAPRPTRRT